MAITVIAFCLGVWHEAPFLAVILAVAVTPALLYTFIMVATKRAAEGRPMAAFDGVGSFFAALAGVVAIALAALIAFFVTCFSSLAVTGRLAPTMDADIAIRSKIALGPAIAAAAITAYLLISWQRRSAREREKP